MMQSACAQEYFGCLESPPVKSSGGSWISIGRHLNGLLSLLGTSFIEDAGDRDLSESSRLHA